MHEFTEELAMEWLKKPCWSIAESVFLLGEHQIPVSKFAGYPFPPEFAGNAGSSMDSLIRAIVTQQLKPIANMEGSIRGRFPVYSPAEVISVAESIDFGKWKNWKKRLGRLQATQIQTGTEMLNKIKADIDAKINYRINKTPEPLFGEGFSDEMRKITTLTKYLELDTWSPMEAAYLVCGIDTDTLQDIFMGRPIKHGKLLSGEPRTENNWAGFNEAQEVLKLWNSQEKPPAKVIPADFVMWCERKGIDTAWLTNGGVMASAHTEPATSTTDTQGVMRLHPTHEIVHEICDQIKGQGQKVSIQTTWSSLLKRSEVTKVDNDTVTLLTRIDHTPHRLKRRTVSNHITAWRKHVK
ncbi:MAG: hypothetical protein ACYCSS_07370 [Sulfuriferula sp.]